jgi:hypothetical protein
MEPLPDLEERHHFRTSPIVVGHRMPNRPDGVLIVSGARPLIIGRGKEKAKGVPRAKWERWDKAGEFEALEITGSWSEKFSPVREAENSAKIKRTEPHGQAVRFGDRVSSMLDLHALHWAHAEDSPRRTRRRKRNQPRMHADKNNQILVLNDLRPSAFICGSILFSVFSVSPW